MKPGVRVDQGPRHRAADEGAACETFPVKAFPVSSGATVCRKEGPSKLGAQNHLLKPTEWTRDAHQPRERLGPLPSKGSADL